MQFSCVLPNQWSEFLIITTFLIDTICIAIALRFNAEYTLHKYFERISHQRKTIQFSPSLENLFIFQDFRFSHTR